MEERDQQNRTTGKKSPGIKARARIDSLMATGIRAIDSLPIGNGHLAP
jgi:F0F1-type ATP synthase alpha subunit